MKAHTPGRWYRTNPRKVFDKETGAEGYDCGIIVADDKGQPHLIGEFFGFSKAFSRQDAVANADRVVVCINALNGFVDPIDTVQKMNESMNRCEDVTRAFLAALEMIPEDRWKEGWRELQVLQTT